MSSIGFLNASRLRGRSLSSWATQSRSSLLCTLRSVPFGKYWRIADLLGFVTIGQVQQHCVAGLAFDQGPDRGLVLLTDDQVPLQLPGTARSSTSGGRSAILIMLGMRFLR